MDEEEKRYQVYGYGDDPGAPAGGQIDLGQFDERMDAEVLARMSVRRDGYKAAHVMRCRDAKVIYHFDRDEAA
jgi:hypothetical protein